MSTDIVRSLVSTFPVVGIGNVGTVFRNEMRRPNFVHAAVCFTCWLRYFEPAGHIESGPNQAARTGGLVDLVEVWILVCLHYFFVYSSKDVSEPAPASRTMTSSGFSNLSGFGYYLCRFPYFCSVTIIYFLSLCLVDAASQTSEIYYRYGRYNTR